MRELLEKFKALTLEKRKHEAAARDLAAAIEVLGEELKTQAADLGLSSLPLESGGRVIFTDRVSARVLDKAVLRRAVVDAGLDDLLSVNAQSLTALCKERIEAGQPIFDGVEIGTFTTVSYRDG